MSSGLSTLVILAGGKGTRMGVYSKQLPKPVVLINKKPLISYLITWAMKNHFRKVIIAGGHLYESLKSEVLNFYKSKEYIVDDYTSKINLKKNFSIIIRNTGKDALTGQRLFCIRDLLNNQKEFVLTYGDTLTDIKINKVHNLFKDTSSTICLVAGFPEARYGEILTEGNRVLSFKEKERPKFRVNRGFYIINSKIFDDWRPRIFKSLEFNVIPYFVNKDKVFAYRSDDWFFSVDTQNDVNELSKKFKHNLK